MTEQDSEDKYIKCSRCKCKYINDDELIKNDFGFTRLGEQLKTCIVCRTKRTQYHKDYYCEHKEQKQEYGKQNIEKNIKNKGKNIVASIINYTKTRQMLCANCE